MPALSRLASLWRNVFHRRQVERDLDDELQAYVDLLSEEKIRAGMLPAEARRAATIEAGGVEQVKEEVRDVRMGFFLETVARDLRHALRSLKRSPGFAAVAVLSLGLGLGLVTTMFAILDATTHPWVPYRDPDRLYTVRYWLSRSRQEFDPAWAVAALRERTHAFEAILPYGFTQARLSAGDGGGTSEGADIVVRAPARLFALLGMKPVRGRLLNSIDVDRGNAMVSEALWRRRFAGQRSLADASLLIGERVYSIVGVMPSSGESFPLMNASVWLPLPDSLAVRPGEFSNILVKLKRGVSRDRANAELRGVATYLTRAYHAEQAPFAFYLWPLRDDPMRLGQIHWAMLGAALAVLLIACTNLANLMLARGFARRRDVALRLAIGASRAAVVREMFIECAVLTAVGAVVGVLLSYWGVDIITHQLPRNVWFLGVLAPHMSWRVFMLSAVAAAGSAVLFGLLPGIRVANSVSLEEPLKDGAGTTGRTRGRYSALVISEVALALALMMGAGLLLKVVHRLTTVEYNYPARQLLGGYIWSGIQADSVPPREQLRFELAVAGTLRKMPGVVDAAVSTSSRPGAAVTAEMVDSTRVLSTGYDLVTPTYLHTMGLPVLQGRDLVDGDLVGNGAVVLNTAAAARLYPHGAAVGRMLKLGSPASNGPWVPIVGVCRTALLPMFGLLDVAAQPEVYVVRAPATSAARAGWQTHLLVRVAQDPIRIGATLSRKLRSLYPRGSAELFPFLYELQSAVAARAFLAKLFVTMGAFALILASVGIYGVMAYAVTRRLREFAVRVALGARRGDLLKAVLQDGLVMTLGGTAIGAFVALGTSNLLQNVLENVNPTDAMTLMISEAVLLAVTVGACLAPALRAAAADPIEILRAT